MDLASMHGKLKEMKALEAAATFPVYGQLPPLVLKPAHVVVKLADALQDIGSSSRHTAGKSGTA
jgi:hypothetical protein